MTSLTGREIAWVALFAALTAVGALFSIPLGPVPFTLQIMFSLLAGALLGSRLGAYSQVVYLLMGIVGLPVFSERGAGPGHLLGPTGGFAVGFVLGALLAGWIAERFQPEGRAPRIAVSAIAMLVGWLGVYAVGVPWLALVTERSLLQALGIMTPFIPADLVKIGLGVAFIHALAARGIRFASPKGSSA